MKSFVAILALAATGTAALELDAEQKAQFQSVVDSEMKNWVARNAEKI